MMVASVLIVGISGIRAALSNSRPHAAPDQEASPPQAAVADCQMEFLGETDDRKAQVGDRQWRLISSQFPSLC